VVSQAELNLYGARLVRRTGAAAESSPWATKDEKIEFSLR